MSYLSQFETDLFISYSHLDNQDDTPWVTRLHKDLERRLSQYLGAAIEVWRDSRLQGNEFLTPAIEEQLAKVAVMVSVVSPRYLLSDWCRRELQGFLNAGGMRPGTQSHGKSRLFKIVPTPVEPRDQPPNTQDLLGYDFYRVDQENGVPRRLPDRDPRPDAEKAYLAKLDDVAFDIHRLLKQMATEQGQSSNPRGAGDNTRSSTNVNVYLAETSSDLTASRDQMRRELLARGFHVFPDHELPREVTEVDETVRRDLETCSLSIHMIGSRYGFVPEGSTHSIIWLQQELASGQQNGHGKRPCILWIPPGLEVKEERQLESIHNLQEQLRDESRFELLKTPLEGLKSYVFDRLIPKPARASAAGKSPDPVERRRIYLICEARDFHPVEAIRKCLFDHGVSVDLPLREGDQQEVRLEHEATLQECDGVLIYYGAGSEGWLREKIRDLRRARGLGRSRPFSPLGVYIAPEATESKQDYMNPEAIVMRNFGVFSPEDLQPFVDRLAEEGAAQQKGVAV
jgi:hypothetical protein